MVKLTGPGVAASAAGKLGDAVAFSNLRKTPYLKTTTKPRDPKTKAQLPVRAAIGFLGLIWKTLTPVEKASWSDKADRAKVARYHAFVRVNSLRMFHDLAPTKVDPATGAGPWAGQADFQAYDGVACIRLTFTSFGPPNVPWGWQLARSRVWPAPMRPEDVIAYFPSTTVGFTTTWYDTPLEPGVYWYITRTFNDEGRWFGPGFAHWATAL